MKTAEFDVSIVDVGVIAPRAFGLGVRARFENIS